MVGYTESDHDQTRNVIYTIGGPGSGLGAGSNTINNSAVSDTESDEISVSVTAGRNFFFDSWTLNPYGRIEYADIEIDGFTERMSQTTALGSGLALQIDDQDFESLMMTFGGTLSTQWAQRYFPQVSVEYVHEFKNNNVPITGRFVNDSSATTFTLLTDQADRNFVNVAAGITALITDSVSGFFRYQGLFAYEDLDIHTFEVGVRIGF
jgi:outer membrane autotransporter protein